jgi:hypothetical protein
MKNVFPWSLGYLKMQLTKHDKTDVIYLNMWPQFSIFPPPYCHYAKVIFTKPIDDHSLLTRSTRATKKHGGKTFSIKHHQQRNNRLRYKQELVTRYQDPLQLHGQTTNLLHQDANHGTVECGRCIRWRSILDVLQLQRRRDKASTSSSLWWSPAAFWWMDVNGLPSWGA